MKTFQSLMILAAIVLALSWVDQTSAKDRWYAGVIRETAANGVTGIISTPQIPLVIRTSGISNWISVYHFDSSGGDWVQTGWLFREEENIPKQYVEWCLDSDSENERCGRPPDFANQNWGTTVDYWVIKQGGATWCAYTAGYQRYCLDNLSSNPLGGEILSEVHINPLNPLDTVFDLVRYQDPADGIWKLYDNQIQWYTQDPPYGVEAFSNYHFRTYRLNTREICLPIISR